MPYTADNGARWWFAASVVPQGVGKCWLSSGRPPFLIGFVPRMGDGGDFVDCGVGEADVLVTDAGSAASARAMLAEHVAEVMVVDVQPATVPSR